MLQNILAPKTACLLIIGNEILSGRTQDTNTRTLALALNAHGIRLSEVRIIPDIEDHIVSTLNACRVHFDHVFTSGGIGPTHDDITAACVAKAFGTTLLLHAPSFTALEQHFGPERFNTARQRMAYLPDGATPIANPVSVAPGFTIGNVHVMAGVPKIFTAMVEEVVPNLPRGAALSMKGWHACGLREGDLAEALTRLQSEFSQTDLGSYPFDRPAVGKGVALIAKGYNAAEVEQAAQAVHDLILAQGQTPISGEPADHGAAT
ncbi:competence-damage protein [Neokomagataea thailandica NBRC 106555]|uniref:Competence/damage-inducible protein A n=2 Tax=Neokomagataea TaxID=1223423 RepID=A0A4Y6V846_9PROT|nr:MULTISPECIES: competence/damage-inducible protein A [Neokomagataea]QDH24811.1 competence/damage-inducible protein A [Neokomagataea tanensis]GBR50015.1 competence-damage protein [Neokomagataea thailandica NBRC 106555]